MSLCPLEAVKDPKKKKQVEYSDLGIFFVLSFFLAITRFILRSVILESENQVI